ncbi:MAG: hypothetical protein ABUL62_21675 [Myxococcales bacterium]|jgi:hypothetical protein
MTSDWSLAALTVMMLAVVGLGVFAGARRSGAEVRSASGAALKTMLALSVWLGLVSFLAVRGVLSNWTALPPRWPLLPLTAFITIWFLMRSPAATRILTSIPAAWLIATQCFRIGVELSLYALHAAGRAPVQITFEGRNFDILVGLSAPLMAWLLATGRLGEKAALAWNVLGLAILANTVATVATSAPGPLHHAWPGAPLTAIASWPTVWLPAFLMPLAVFLHVASLRQNVRALRSK